MPEPAPEHLGLNWKRSKTGSAAEVFILWELTRLLRSFLLYVLLNQAKEKGQDLVTICSACHHVIKRVNDDMKNVEDIRTRANNYMQLDEPYEGETTVLHYLEVLRDRVGFDKLKEKVVNPLNRKENRSLLRMSLITSGQDHGI